MAYIMIADESYSIDSVEDEIAARIALAMAGLETAYVWHGEDDGLGDSYRTGRVLFATSHAVCDAQGWYGDHTQAYYVGTYAECAGWAKRGNYVVIKGVFYLGEKIHRADAARYEQCVDASRVARPWAPFLSMAEKAAKSRAEERRYIRRFELIDALHRAGFGRLRNFDKVVESALDTGHKLSIAELVESLVAAQREKSEPTTVG